MDIDPDSDYEPEERRFFDVACGFLEFAISSVCPLSARYFLSPAKGGSLPPPGYSRAGHCFLCDESVSCT
jgi:hypothetical protein